MKKMLSKKRALEILDRFPLSRVLVIGDIMADHFIWGKVTRISPEAPVPVVSVTSESLLLGGAANVLNNVFSLGGRAFIAGIAGRDEMGSWIRERLREMKVDTDGIIITPDRPTSVKTRVIAHSQQVVRFDREDRNPVGAGARKKIAGYLESMLDDIEAVVISDYNKGLVSEELLHRIRNLCSGAGIPLFIDPKKNGFSLYRDCGLMTPNQAEAAMALGMDINTRDDLVRAGRRLLEEYHLKGVLITRGEEGMALFEDNGAITHIPAVAKEVFDVTGAGDTVIGTFALATTAGATAREAAVLANHAAGIAVGKVGTATVTREELLRVL
ncbi:MAG: D-glycero-beta-D-manno-heptose-7-phosphate kinase [Syntrophales bacterium]|jgi:D-beta-D-heptose 7-phosphate kinase/D-beta-D-heptose 1-phosphate adenosyltransferase|nr:D-glycero-beta-D-manno-heptose-7-phosphate kinase [Syntrophales bacterium]MCK9527725.1 D-glycero-beta-D-manno-heptose-7-phosphate kinase [Syntrophales bacterium]MDX9921620.1 D-glycero-beta-D-manno-heptose-7-phosphate kinase [Syntrophales bacterium]